MVGELQGFLEHKTGGPDESEPSGKASQRRRHLSGPLRDEEELVKRRAGVFQAKGTVCAKARRQ